MFKSLSTPNTTALSLDNGFFVINSKFTGSVYHWNANRYKFLISVIYKKRKFSFTFYDSVYNFNSGKNQLNDEDRIHALNCTFMDALAYVQHETLKEFADAFGYDIEDEDSRYETRRIYNACEDSFDRLRMDEDKLCDILNEMSEKDLC